MADTENTETTSEETTVLTGDIDNVKLSFSDIFASEAPSDEMFDWSYSNYYRGWGYLGYSAPPPMELFNRMQNMNDLKAYKLYQQALKINQDLINEISRLTLMIQNMKAELQDDYNAKFAKGTANPYNLVIKWQSLNDDGEVEEHSVTYNGSAGMGVDLTGIYGMGVGGSGGSGTTWSAGAGVYNLISEDTTDAIVASNGSNSGEAGSNGKLQIITDTQVDTIISSEGLDTAGAGGSAGITIETTTDDEIDTIVV